MRTETDGDERFEVVIPYGLPNACKHRHAASIHQQIAFCELSRAKYNLNLWDIVIVSFSRVECPWSLLAGIHFRNATRNTAKSSISRLHVNCISQKLHGAMERRSIGNTNTRYSISLWNSIKHREYRPTHANTQLRLVQKKIHSFIHHLRPF